MLFVFVFISTNISNLENIYLFEIPISLKMANSTSIWINKHNKIIENNYLNKQNIKSIWIGDSIAEGLVSLNTEVWKRFKKRHEVAILGISGDKVENVLWRLDNEEIDNIKPDLAILMIGTNNSNVGDQPMYILNGIINIIKLINLKLPNTKIIILSILPAYPTNNFNQFTNNYNTNLLIKNHPFLIQNNCVNYLDLWNIYLNSEGAINTKLMPDQLHLSEEGYNTLIELLDNYIFILKIKSLFSINKTC